jgi:hypothetical protein
MNEINERLGKKYNKLKEKENQKYEKKDNYNNKEKEKEYEIDRIKTTIYSNRSDK